MWNSEEKKMLDKELELYRREKMLEVDIQVKDKIAVVWSEVQSARRQAMEDRIKIETETAKLVAKKEALSECLSAKDKEIAYLKELLSTAVTRTIK